MENFFDQFDPKVSAQEPTGARNFFDQFDAPPTATPDVAAENNEFLGGRGARAALGMGRPMVGATQAWAKGGSAVADYLGAGDTMVGRGGHKIAALSGEMADQFADWAKRGRVAAGLEEEAKLFSPSTWDIPATVGDVLSPINLAAGGLVNRGLAATKVGTGLWGRMAQAGAYGGASGLTQPVTTGDLTTPSTEDEPGVPKSFGEAKLEQVGSGIAGGMIAGPAIGLAGDVIGPQISKAARYLSDRGVKLSPGQTLQGIPNRVESGLTSAPISGELVREARAEAIPGYNRAAANEALENIGKTIPEDIAPGHDTYNHVEKTISDNYTAIHSRVNVTEDQQLRQDLSRIVRGSTNSLPREKVQYLADLIKSNVITRFQDRMGNLSGQELQTVQSKIKALSRGYISSGEKSGNPEHTALGEYLDDARRAIDDLVARQNPQEAQALKDTNRAFAHEIILRKATAAPSTQKYHGAFGPQELGAAMNRVTTERNRARGKAFYQDLVEYGKEIIPQRLPDSGTSERREILGLLGVGGAHAAGLGLHAAVGLGSLAAAYSPPAQWLLRKALLSAPKTRGPMGDFIRQYGPRAAIPMITSAIRGQQSPQAEGD